ncbi:Chromo domain/shadow and Chromo domain-like and Chromo domain-containing protein [Strongyloides ratti]|uniref:Chromo domain/shadow and Chromo domain-like and Chromo domain-containing protein n=1 Tax=Strongyloides ratti TaxID=34506 RepID=A0A090MZ87_STRRB|nr:Chromo domain/shadow and Chromo domain-like and Chromo domain-containing protein [Strongyloides ratti]CEF68504.1 Chromo domain/shadow and Chromo domain-like and Chromo domain-containing protein [Strongyloides ratti]
MMKKSKDNSDDSSVEYDVEKILDKKKMNGTTFYEVKWLGYVETTWEPSCNIGPSLIKKFEKNFVRKSLDSKRKDNNDNEVKMSPSKKKRKINFAVKTDRKSSNLDFEPIESGEKKSDLINNSSEVRRRSLRQCRLSGMSVKRRTSSRLSKSIEGNEIVPEIETPKNNITKINNTPLLKESYSQQDTSTEELSEEIDGSKGIVDHRIRDDGIKEYRIRWKGFPEEEDTWQTSDTFIDSRVVDLYEKKIANSVSSNENDHGLLCELIKEAENGKKYETDEIFFIIALFVNKDNEKLYLVALKNYDIAVIRSENVPIKFKKECSIVDKRVIHWKV